MPSMKKEHPEQKSELHPRNRHRERYDFKLLTSNCAALTPFVQRNRYQDESIDFANPEAVKMLNKALLKQYYQLEDWDIPPGYLCPPIPARADYLHYIADLLAASNDGKIPRGGKVVCLDIGVGANCVYPIIGHAEYGWHFIGTDIDPIAIAAANKIIAANPALKDAVECRLQQNTGAVFQGMLAKDEFIDLTICNPPFHDSPEAAEAGTLRKLGNLNQKKPARVVRNFGGQGGELWCEGGEKAFIINMIRESEEFAHTCFWFSTLVSKESNLKSIEYALKGTAASEIKIIPMKQGQKTSRIVAWTFLNHTQQQAWRNMRWHAKPVKKIR